MSMLGLENRKAFSGVTATATAASSASMPNSSTAYSTVSGQLSGMQQLLLQQQQQQQLQQQQQSMSYLYGHTGLDGGSYSADSYFGGNGQNGYPTGMGYGQSMLGYQQQQPTQQQHSQPQAQEPPRPNTEGYAEYIQSFMDQNILQAQTIASAVHRECLESHMDPTAANEHAQQIYQSQIVQAQQALDAWVANDIATRSYSPSNIPGMSHGASSRHASTSSTLVSEPDTVSGISRGGSRAATPNLVSNMLGQSQLGGASQVRPHASNLVRRSHSGTSFPDSANSSSKNLLQTLAARVPTSATASSLATSMALSSSMNALTATALASVTNDRLQAIEAKKRAQMLIQGGNDRISGLSTAAALVTAISTATSMTVESKSKSNSTTPSSDVEHRNGNSNSYVNTDRKRKADGNIPSAFDIVAKRNAGTESKADDRPTASAAAAVTVEKPKIDMDALQLLCDSSIDLMEAEQRADVTPQSSSVPETVSTPLVRKTKQKQTKKKVKEKKMPTTTSDFLDAVVNASEPQEVVRKKSHKKTIPTTTQPAVAIETNEHQQIGKKKNHKKKIPTTNDATVPIKTNEQVKKKSQEKEIPATTEQVASIKASEPKEVVKKKSHKKKIQTSVVTQSTAKVSEAVASVYTPTHGKQDDFKSRQIISENDPVVDISISGQGAKIVADTAIDMEITDGAKLSVVNLQTVATARSRMDENFPPETKKSVNSFEETKGTASIVVNLNKLNAISDSESKSSSPSGGTSAAVSAMRHSTDTDMMDAAGEEEEEEEKYELRDEEKEQFRWSLVGSEIQVNRCQRGWEPCLVLDHDTETNLFRLETQPMPDPDRRDRRRYHVSSDEDDDDEGDDEGVVLEQYTAFIYLCGYAGRTSTEHGNLPLKWRRKRGPKLKKLRRKIARVLAAYTKSHPRKYKVSSSNRDDRAGHSSSKERKFVSNEEYNQRKREMRAKEKENRKKTNILNPVQQASWIQMMKEQEEVLKMMKEEDKAGLGIDDVMLWSTARPARSARANAPVYNDQAAFNAVLAQSQEEANAAQELRQERALKKKQNRGTRMRSRAAEVFKTEQAEEEKRPVVKVESAFDRSESFVRKKKLKSMKKGRPRNTGPGADAERAKKRGVGNGPKRADQSGNSNKEAMKRNQNKKKTKSKRLIAHLDSSSSSGDESDNFNDGGILSDCSDESDRQKDRNGEENKEKEDGIESDDLFRDDGSSDDVDEVVKKKMSHKEGKQNSRVHASDISSVSSSDVESSEADSDDDYKNSPNKNRNKRNRKSPSERWWQKAGASASSSSMAVKTPEFTPPVGDSAVGWYVSVFWPHDNEFYQGQVTDHRRGGKHHVLYDDGEREWLNLPTQSMAWFVCEKEGGDPHKEKGHWAFVESIEGNSRR